MIDVISKRLINSVASPITEVLYFGGPSTLMTDRMVGVNGTVFVADLPGTDPAPDYALDLNDGFSFPCQYDLVVNNGTLEHCYNVGLAMRTMWDAVAVNKYLLHIAPVSLLNHGFWNINPLAIIDWCRYNGGKVQECVYAINGDPSKIVSPSAIKTSKSGRGQLPPETVMYALAQKVKEVPFRWPVQGIYES
jgi:hypothetical protein